MEKQNEIQLWRVEMIHRNGYQAPALLVEATERKEAHKEVMKMKLRLLEFPNSWSFQLTRLNVRRFNGKWY